MFRIRNVKTGRSSHCGVLEFSAPDSMALLPSWLMTELELTDSDSVMLTLVDLPKVNFVRLRPMQFAFDAIPNPKAA